ncbi:hypothetical protein ACKKBG_A02685 [Auxenochlorella protothecoides x Auxenochlorella symbiontica]|uniref:Putative bolA-like protein C8C9.11 n=1 Tax=Auxenochlorella protothecoides TaxID=3075 RepID=A0A087SJM3_AUXPR|nr:putative bolA-like protein C8C9.11 [Auxenochlorella protothecoides]KFM25927.1 putative bolA-like protein C8C9.11 [Auxenochlorella protothecoides]
MVSEEDVREAIAAHLSDAEVNVTDISNGCGTGFEVQVVAQAFEGKRLLERHKLVNAALKDIMPNIHALSITRAWTPQQAAAA